MVRKTREEALETRSKILKTSLKMFYEKGFHATTLNDVAQSMGTTRGAIYWHFRSKGDILRALWNERSSHIERTVSEFSSIMDSKKLCSIDEYRCFLEQILNCLVYSFNENTESRLFFHIIHIMLISGNDNDVLYVREQTKRVDELLFITISNIVKLIKKRDGFSDDAEIKEKITYLHFFLDGYFMNCNNLIGFSHTLYEDVSPSKVVNFIMKILFHNKL